MNNIGEKTITHIYSTIGISRFYVYSKQINSHLYYHQRFGIIRNQEFIKPKTRRKSCQILHLFVSNMGTDRIGPINDQPPDYEIHCYHDTQNVCPEPIFSLDDLRILIVLSLLNIPAT